MPMKSIEDDTIAHALVHSPRTSVAARTSAHGVTNILLVVDETLYLVTLSEANPDSVLVADIGETSDLLPEMLRHGNEQLSPIVEDESLWGWMQDCAEEVHSTN